MISTKHRFHGYGSLRFVYRQGQTVRGPFFSIKSVRNDRRSQYRMAAIVSRKVNKSAVIRNRIRRRLYEAVRSLEAEITASYDIVFTVFSDEILNLSTVELHKQVKKMLIRAGAITRRTDG